MKIAIKIIAFVCLAAILLIACNSALSFKYLEGIKTMNYFYEQEENSVDVLILGSSHAFKSFYPEILWEEYGYSSYVMSASIQPLWFSYYYLEEALKTQTPKLVVLEAYRFQEQSDYTSRQTVTNNLYGMKWSKTKWDAFRVGIPTKEESEDKALLNTPWEFSNYHSRYSELSAEDFLEDYANPAYEYFKGGSCSEGVYAKKPMPDIASFEKKPGPITEKNETWYRKLLELAAANGIPVLTVLAPMPTTQECYSRMLTARAIAEEYGQTFIDYNDHYEELNIDFKTDIMDQAGHLNKSGAEKFSSAVGKYISEHYDIPDHRGDPKYESWELATKAYHRLYDDGNMKLSDKPSQYVQQGLNNGDYDFVVTWNSPHNATEEFTAEARATLESLGISFEGGEMQDGAWIVRNGEVIYGNTKQEALKKGHQFDRQRDILISYGVPDVKDWATTVEQTGQKEQVFYLTDDAGTVIATEGLVIYTYDTWLSDPVNTYRYVVGKQ